MGTCMGGGAWQAQSLSSWQPRPRENEGRASFSFWQGDVKRELPWESITFLNCSKMPHMHWSYENNSVFREWRLLCITGAAVCEGGGKRLDLE